MKSSVSVASLFAFSVLLAAITACGSASSSGGGTGGNPPPPPPAATVTAVSMSCGNLTVKVGQTSPCSVTVTGTGSYSSAVNWTVNSVAGGNATVGTVSTSGLYTAPAAVPTPFTVTLIATSVEDATKSATFNVIVAGTIASVSQTISASAGGTITLPDGSSVTIPAGLLAADQTVTLSESSSLPQQPPNQFIVGVGTALQLTFSTPIQPSLRSTGAGTSSRSVRNLISPNNNASSSLTFAINQEQVPSGLNGAIGIAEITDTTNTTNYISTSYSAENQTSSLTVPTSWLSGLQHSVSSVAVSAINTAYQVFDFLPPSIELPVSRCWQPDTSSWADFSSCSGQIEAKRVLVVVHGMMSCVEDSFTPLAEYMQNIKPDNSNSPYLIVGFDYDWTQRLTDSGALLEAFLEQIAKQQPSGIDIVAHSEGVPVSLYAVSQTPHRALIGNFFALAGPILGTPVMKDPSADWAIYLNYDRNPLNEQSWLDVCPASKTFHDMTYQSILQSQFALDLQPNSTAISQIIHAVQGSLGNTKIFVAGGENSGALEFVYKLGSPFGATPNDGIVGLDSALGYNSGFPVHPLPPFPSLFHTNLPSDPGVLNDIRSEISQSNSPQLDCVSTLDNCDGAQNDPFTFAGTGFSSSGSNVLVYSQDSTGAVRLLPSSTLVDSGGTITWPMPLGTQPTGLFSIFAFDNTFTLASNNVMQTVGPPTGPTVTVNVNPPSVTLAPDGTQSFSATVSGTTDKAVSWSATGGTITPTGASSATYTAPAADGTYSVVATSHADSNATATATVTVSGVSSGVTISPQSVSVPEGGIQTFTATVSSGGGVTWSVHEGNAGGTITNAGVYTAPNTTGTFHVVAASATDISEIGVATVAISSGYSYKILHTFGASGTVDNGLYPGATLIQGSDGLLYGTTQSYNVFRTDTLGNITSLGFIPGYASVLSGPVSSLLKASDGNFYGTAASGEEDPGNPTVCVPPFTSFQTGCGLAFKVDTSGNVSALHYFSSDDVAISPYAALIQGKDGNFYGTTYYGGVYSCDPNGLGCGTIFRMDTSGNITVLHSFSGSDGGYPTAALVQGSDGSFYGTTSGGGNPSCGGAPESSLSGWGCGTIFKIDAAGRFTLLHSFSGSAPDGMEPLAALIQGSDGSFYGTTSGGYSNGGSVFKVDASGDFTVLHSFSGPDGAFPVASLLLGKDGYFYGTTWAGGGPCFINAWVQNYPYLQQSGCGVVFRMDHFGNVTVLHAFAPAPADGTGSVAGLLQSSDGTLYGTTLYGGLNNYGVIFQLRTAP